MILKFAPKRVLIVDDNRDAADLTAELLSHYGHVTETAYDGFQAIKTALVFIPDVILLDLGMPLLDGFQVAIKVRKIPEMKNVVLIAYTAWGDSITRSKTKTYGFDQHIAKPASVDYLLQEIANLKHVTIQRLD